jgi:hypothetical protein
MVLQEHIDLMMVGSLSYPEWAFNVILNGSTIVITCCRYHYLNAMELQIDNMDVIQVGGGMNDIMNLRTSSDLWLGGMQDTPENLQSLTDNGLVGKVRPGESHCGIGEAQVQAGEVRPGALQVQ